MPVTDAQARALAKRLRAARGRILSEQGFYGLLLMHLKFALGDEYDTAWVSRDTVTFNPEFAAQLDADELCFVLEHEVMHAALNHLERRDDREPMLWNLACDIVVNSNIKRSHGGNPKSITLRCEGEQSFHLAPNGKEGWRYTADEVYEMLKKNAKVAKVMAVKAACGGDGQRVGWDWHIANDGMDSAAEAACKEAWAQRLADARESMSVRDPSNARGLVPACAERLLEELRSSMVDWRLLLDEFVQEEVCDYSFAPPDRRFPEAPFLLPSYSDTETVVRDVLFMVDTSGSVCNRELAAAYGEIKGAIEQFKGKIKGWLGFFDAIAYEPQPFESVADILAIRPHGGGGTRFEAVFEGIERWMDTEEISCIVIITDGYAPVPDESMARGIPVLWLITDGGPAPTWGKVARIK